VATLSGDSNGLEVEVNPRAATSLIAFGVELVADPKDASLIPHIHVSPSADGCHISVERNTGKPGEDLMLLRRGIVPPTLPCVAAAARANGATLEFDAELSRFTLTFGKAFPGRMTG
jgi:hypothetical protein